MSTLAAGKNKAKMVPWEYLKEQDLVLIKSILEEKTYELKDEILKLRADQFKKAGLQSEDIENKIFNAKEDLRASDLVKLGYIDEINHFENICEHHFSGIKVLNYHTPEYTNIGGEQIFSANSTKYVLSNRLLSM